MSDEVGSSMNCTSGGSGWVSWSCWRGGTRLSRRVRFGMDLTDWVFVVEGEFQSVGLVFVDWVVVEDFDVHLPFF